MASRLLTLATADQPAAQSAIQPAHGWPAAKILRLALFYLAAAALAVALILGGAPAPEGLSPIGRAEFLAAGPESRAVPVELPDRCTGTRKPVGCAGTYHLTFRYDTAGGEPWSLYVPTFAGRIDVRVNGVFLTDSRRVRNDAVVTQTGPLLALIPSSVLHEGENRLDIGIEAWSRFGGFLEPVFVGPDRLLHPAFGLRDFTLTTLPRLLIAWQAALFACLLIVWIGCRGERIYLVMSLILGFGVLQGVPLFMTGTEGADWLARMGNLTGIWQATLLPGVIARLVGRDPPIPLRWRLIAPMLVTLSYLPGIAAPALQPWFGVTWIAVGLPWVMTNLWLSIWLAVSAAFRRNHAAAQFVVGGLIVTVILTTHDVLAAFGVWQEQFPMLVRFVGPMLMTVIAATLMWRFAMALTEVSRFNGVMREEVAAAEAALRSSFEREQARNRAAALEAERLRLTRDLHDGLAGQLVSIVAQCELPTRDYGRIAQAARRALDDLRLVISSMDDVGNDLAMMLAQFHERIGPQLQAQGVELDWQMAPLPDVEGLRSEHALALFRILQEAVTNAVRHSGCAAVTIIMAPAPEDRPGHAVRITVADRGRGGIPDQARRQGHGLGNMRRRAAGLGAGFSVESGTGGTRVVIDLPRVLPGPVPA